ncbi:MAG TPA: alpha-N-acetylglucosaminidase [Paludibacter sp.]
MKRKNLLYTLVFGSLIIFSNMIIAQENTSIQNEKAVYELINRVLPDDAAQFEVVFIPKENEKDLFEIESVNGKIVLRGNNGISVASALNYYLKNYAHCSITWNGTNLNLPHPLPEVTVKIQHKSPYKYRYYLNYCTFNYSMSWWDWDRWQKEIDWMALNGINMPLAVTGQNSVWKRVYNSLGFTDKELESFFSGPAYFNWFWMGNLDGWGGPLTKSFMDGHEAMQKKILNQERLLGMTPILPAFTGHVPPTFKDKFPDTKLKQTSWVGFPDVNILDPNEPMFTEIGKRFIEEEIRTYGTNHLYSADTFNENTPPTNDSVYLNNVSQKVYQSMALADPQATWIMQGWLFYHSDKFWKTKEIKAILNAVPNDKMIVLDLWSERFPVWKRTEAYYGKPWIWNMLHNFGQNISLSGLMSSVANNPAEALHSPESGKMLGIGLTMEGIEQNPVIYDLMLENVWRDTPIDLDSWLKDYALRRYGKSNEDADKAWQILSRTVYADSITNGGAESIITARPTFLENPGGTSTTKLPYNAMELVKAWSLIMAASDDLKNSDGFQFDVVDITRQVLANYASKVQQQIARDYKNKDAKAFKQSSAQFIVLISDLDNLLSTRKDFLLGNWLNDAKKWGNTPEEKELYEKNARNLITLWGDRDNRLHEYACKQWAGMLNGFYKIRWEKFFDQVNRDMVQNKEFDQKLFDEVMKDWEWNWVNATETYTTEIKGDAVKSAMRMHSKYYKTILKAYK